MISDGGVLSSSLPIFIVSEDGIIGVMVVEQVT